MKKKKFNRYALAALVYTLANPQSDDNKVIADSIVMVCRMLHNEDLTALYNKRMADGIRYALIEHPQEYKDLISRDDIETLLTERF